MQINPHYIYNTLASIKWLVYQNDTAKTVRTIDAFISLLRNTISNSDEFIPVETGNDQYPELYPDQPDEIWGQYTGRILCFESM